MAGRRPGGKGSALPRLQDLVNADLKTGDFRPVYVLAGDDALRMEQVVHAIRDRALGESSASFNYHALQGDQVEMARVMQQAMSLPMFAGVQLIWVKHAEKVLGDAASQEVFEKYLATPVKETILVLSMDRADRRKKWVKACQSAGYLFDFSPPAGEELVRWVVKAAQREQLPLGADQAQVLCELVGNDLLSLKSEIDKLALLAEDRGRPLETAEIGRIIMDQAELDGYEITSQLSPGKAADVLRTWFRLAEWGRSAYEIAPLVASRVRKGSLLDACRASGQDDRDTASRTSQNPWSFRYLEPMLRALGPEGLRAALKAALDCDRSLKSSPLKPDIILEKTIADVCARRDRT
ncbi:MAG: DNA polymerase III subunit delta [bacterium]|nr:DNA polymerase III subunit delta [bacterium]